MINVFSYLQFILLTLGRAGFLFLLKLSSVAAIPLEPASDTLRLQELSSGIFQALNTSNGLPHAFVTSLAQDKNGFIWVGTQGGLARWDGYHFRHFDPVTNDEESIPDTVILSLHIDIRGRLWIGTNSGGLARYDDATDRFIRIPMGGKGSSHSAIVSIIDDGTDGLWIGSRGGLDHLQFKDDSISHEKDISADSLKMATSEVRSLVRDCQGMLWVGTGKGLFAKDEKSNSYMFVPLPGSDKAAPKILSLGKSSDCKIWVGTLGHGAFVVERTAIPAVDAISNLSVRPVLEKGNAINLINKEDISSIQEVIPGKVWLGTLGQGIVIVDVATMTTRREQHKDDLPYSLANNIVSAILRDKAGLVWVGTQRGISRINVRQAGIKSIFGGVSSEFKIRDTDITSVLPLANGDIWLGLGSNGVNIIHPATDKITWIKSNEENPAFSLPRVAINAMVESSDNEIYLASAKGLYRAYATDLSGKKINLVTTAPRHSVEPVTALMKDERQLWMGGPDGLWILDLTPPVTGRTRRIPGTEALNNDIIVVLEKDGDKGVWIGTRHHGLYWFDKSVQKIEHIWPIANAETNASAYISSVLLDTRGRLWISTLGDGIVLFDKPHAPRSTNQVAGPVRLTTRDGLPNAIVDKIFEDRKNRIWVSTDKGLAVVNPDTLKIQSFELVDGAAIQVHWLNSGAKTASGDLLFGGVDGLSVVQPELFNGWDYSAPLVITDVE